MKTEEERFFDLGYVYVAGGYATENHPTTKYTSNQVAGTIPNDVTAPTRMLWVAHSGD